MFSLISRCGGKRFSQKFLRSPVAPEALVEGGLHGFGKQTLGLFQGGWATFDTPFESSQANTPACRDSSRRRGRTRGYSIWPRFRRPGARTRHTCTCDRRRDRPSTRRRTRRPARDRRARGRERRDERHDPAVRHIGVHARQARRRADRPCSSRPASTSRSRSRSRRTP